VASGLVADHIAPLVAEVSGTNVSLFTVPYFDTGEEGLSQSWALVKAAAQPVLDSFEGLKDAPTLLQLLVRGTAGWPFAAAQLGASLRHATTLPLSGMSEDGLLEFMKRIEGKYTQALSRYYSADSVLQSLELKEGGAGANKLRCLLLSPHSVYRSTARVRGDGGLFHGFMACVQVDMEEPINGKTIRQLRQRGLLGMIPATPRANLSNYSGRVYLRMALPLLSQLFGAPRDPTAFYGQNDHPEFLRWMKYGNTKYSEQAELVSLRVSLEALCVMEVNSAPLTLGNLRPGAVFATEALRSTSIEVDKDAIKRAVLGGKNTHIPIFPSEKELNAHPTTAMVHYTKKNQTGVDALFRFGQSQAYYLQFKGVELAATTRRLIGPGEVIEDAQKMLQGVNGTPVALELCYTMRVPSLEGNSTFPVAKLATNTDKLVVIHRANAVQALGWVFAGALNASNNSMAGEQAQPKKKSAKKTKPKSSKKAIEQPKESFE
jgi:hypothetical protein